MVLGRKWLPADATYWPLGLKAKVPTPPWPGWQPRTRTKLPSVTDHNRRVLSGDPVAK